MHSTAFRDDKGPVFFLSPLVQRPFLLSLRCLVTDDLHEPGQASPTSHLIESCAPAVFSPVKRCSAKMQVVDEAVKTVTCIQQYTPNVNLTTAARTKV